MDDDFASRLLEDPGLRKAAAALGRWDLRGAVTALSGVLGTALGGPLAGAGAAAAAELVVKALANDATLRLLEEGKRLDDEAARQRELARLLAKGLARVERQGTAEVLAKLAELERGRQDEFVAGLRFFDRRFDDVERLLRELRAAAGLPRLPEELLRSYRESLAREHDRLPGLFPSAMAALGLHAVFVELDVLDDVPDDDTAAHAGSTAQRRGRGKQSESAADRRRGGAANRRGAGPRAMSHERAAGLSADRLTLHDLLSPETTNAAPSPRWVVRGDPGAGKSTLARHLTWTLARSDDGPLAVYAPLPKLLATEPEAVHPFDFAEKSIGLIREERAGLAATLRELAQTPGKVWLLLDGLDEVGTRFEAAHKLLDDLAADLPSVAIAVFTRPIGYAALGGAYREARIVELSNPRQTLLLEKLLGADTDARAVAAHALERSTALRDACRLPLSLTLLAFVALDHAQKMRAEPAPPGAEGTTAEDDRDALPANRLGLFDRSLDILLTSGHRSRAGKAGGAGGITNPKAARAVLAELSLALQRDRIAGADTGFPELYLLEIMNELRGEHGSRVKKLWDWGESTKDFLDAIAAKTGVLADYGGPDDWRFFHRQFRELLAAEALRDNGQKELEQRAAWLGKTPASIPAWAEVLGFACALSEEPLELLRLLGNVDENLALRVLPEVENLDPVEALGTLKKDGAWDGDFLRTLCRRWSEQGLELERASEWLWAQVPRARTTQELAYFYYALDGLAELARRPLGEGAQRDRFNESFFQACQRWPAPEPPELVPVPADEFLMGSPEDEPERTPDETQHSVRLSAFFLAATTVTNAEYERFDPGHQRETFEGRPSKNDAAQHPVVRVSWWEAALYCRWLGGRLPTEAEWEYACRAASALARDAGFISRPAGTPTPFAFGDTITTEQVNYDGRRPYAGGAKGEYRGRTVAVKELAKNRWGLYQMHGNVWEWCADWYGEFPTGDVQVDPTGPAEGTARVLRGGSWLDVARDARSAQRYDLPPELRYVNIGFRLARGRKTSE